MHFIYKKGTVAVGISLKGRAQSSKAKSCKVVFVTKIQRLTTGDRR